VMLQQLLFYWPWWKRTHDRPFLSGCGDHFAAYPSNSSWCMSLQKFANTEIN
jgi:hypothetical protein